MSTEMEPFFQRQCKGKGKGSLFV